MLEAVAGKVSDVAGNVLKDYVNKYYADQEKDFLTRHISPHLLTAANYPELFPENQRMVVKAPVEYAAEMALMLKDIEKFYQQDVDAIPTLHFDHHLYSPIAVWREKERNINPLKPFP